MVELRAKFGETGVAEALGEAHHRGLTAAGPPGKFHNARIRHRFRRLQDAVRRPPLGAFEGIVLPAQFDEAAVRDTLSGTGGRLGGDGAHGLGLSCRRAG